MNTDNNQSTPSSTDLHDNVKNGLSNKMPRHVRVDEMPVSTKSNIPLFGKLGTILVTIFSVIGFLGIQLVTLLFALLILMQIMPDKFGGVDSAVSLIRSDGTVLAVSLIFTLIAICLYVCFIIKIRKKSLSDYLALKGFGFKVTLMALLIWVLYVIFIESMFHLFDYQPIDFLASYVASAEPLWLLILGVVLFAPIYEELIFRGLIWKMIAEQFINTKKGAIIATLLTSLFFAGIHLQYDLVSMGSIFVLGLLLGFVRYRSGSLWLVILLHIINNGVSMLQYILLQ